MATTPEGCVKSRIDILLKAQGAKCWYAKPVQNGMGTPMLDYHGAHAGFAFAIEAKKPGGEPTERQKATARALIQAGAAVFLIDGDLSELYAWLNAPCADPYTRWRKMLDLHRRIYD